MAGPSDAAAGSVALGDGAVAGPSTESTLPGSATEGPERARPKSGSRQLSLAHWLL